MPLRGRGGGLARDRMGDFDRLPPIVRFALNEANDLLSPAEARRLAEAARRILGGGGGKEGMVRDDHLSRGSSQRVWRGVRDKPRLYSTAAMMGP